MAREGTGQTASSASLRLPTLVVAPTDVNRLVRELEALEDFLRQAQLRQPGTTVQLPRTSRLLEEVAMLNKLNWLQAADRQRAAVFLVEVKTKAPIVHISFASDPSAAFMQKLTIWLRNNIHPLLLVRIGLQPTIAAGCIVRTSNHIFDFSLRRRFTDQRQLLLDKLRSNDAQL